MTQDFADVRSTQKVLDLLEELLPEFQGQLHTLTVGNNSEIELYNNLITAQNDILSGAQERKLSAEKDLEGINALIEEELTRLNTAQDDLDRANLDFDNEEHRWDGETTAHLDLLHELEAELDALNQCIDLFSSPEMNKVGDDMLEKLNQL
jgi:hypothetical protein